MPVFKLTFTVLTQVHDEDEATTVGERILNELRDAGYDTTFERVD